MYRVYCLNYTFNESQVNMTNTNFMTSLLRCNQLLLEWVQITKYFQTHCTLLKFIIRDMLFPTKLTSLINTLGLIDSASLENHHNNRRDSGSHKWPKTFFGRCSCGTKNFLIRTNHFMNTDLGSDWISHIHIFLHPTNIKCHGIIAHDGA